MPVEPKSKKYFPHVNRMDWQRGSKSSAVRQIRNGHAGEPLDFLEPVRFDAGQYETEADEWWWRRGWAWIRSKGHQDPDQQHHHHHQQQQQVNAAVGAGEAYAGNNGDNGDNGEHGEAVQGMSGSREERLDCQSMAWTCLGY